VHHSPTISISVKAAVETSCLHKTKLIGEDTDLQVLLLHYIKAHCKGLYFRSDKTTGNAKVYNLNYQKEMIGNDMCSQLLFIHAMSGCDTTSRMFGVGKKSAFHKLVKEDTILRYSANTFATLHQPREVIDDLGCQVMAVVLGGKSTESLA